MKRYTLIDNQTKQVYKNSIRLKDLYETLNRSKSSVYGTIWRIEQGRFNNIRDVNGKSYTLIIKNCDK